MKAAKTSLVAQGFLAGEYNLQGAAEEVKCVGEILSLVISVSPER